MICYVLFTILWFAYKILLYYFTRVLIRHPSKNPKTPCSYKTNGDTVDGILCQKVYIVSLTKKEAQAVY